MIGPYVDVIIECMIAFVNKSVDPLADWRNDDLLLTEDVRHAIAQASPRAFRILDWPQLRLEFEKHDALAIQAKRKLNRHGLRGALLSTVGATLLALAPLIRTTNAQKTVIVFGCVAVLLGAVVGFWHLSGHSGRAKWLGERLWTERLRQFNFQYLINNTDAAVAAMSNDEELVEYQSLRAGALKVFLQETEAILESRGLMQAIRLISNDHGDERVWAQSSWDNCDRRLSQSQVITDNHRELLECLSRGRIGIQEIYAQRNLKSGAASQGSLARRNSSYANVMTITFVVVLTLAGVRILLGGSDESLTSDILIALSGVAASWGLYFRLIDQGMGYSLDSERYELYTEQINHVRQRFSAAADDLSEKLIALRMLEVYSYREMRQFFRTHLRSRFL